MPPKEGKRIRCLVGENACPPEDVGGACAYFDFMVRSCEQYGFDDQCGDYPAGLYGDGIAKDADGSDMDVMLFARANHRVWEFEIIRYHPGPVNNPDWSIFQVK